MEQLVLLVIFLLVGLLNLIVRWLRRGTEAPEPVPAPPPPTRELPPGARVRVPVPPPEALVPAVRRTPSPAPDPHARRRRSVHRHLGSRAEVRRAIVVMTVLGPCRALEEEPGISPSRPAGS